MPKLSFCYIFRLPSIVPRPSIPWILSNARVEVEFAGIPRCCKLVNLRNLKSSGTSNSSKAGCFLCLGDLTPNKFLRPEKAISYFLLTSA